MPCTHKTLSRVPASPGVAGGGAVVAAAGTEAPGTEAPGMAVAEIADGSVDAT
jgi:hypothetical protein